MEQLDIAVVGSGIGGSLIATLSRHRNLLLFEQDTNVGGCASTFRRHGSYFNAGATTFVGYEEGHITKRLFDKAGVTPTLKSSKIAMRVVQNSKELDRTQDLEGFLEALALVHPHPNNRLFWSTLKGIDGEFWQVDDGYYAKHSVGNYLKTARFATKLFGVFGWKLLRSASSFIDEMLPDIDEEYRRFLNAQLLITIQSPYQNVSLLALALALCYPFHDTYYVMGGMGSLIEEVLQGVRVHTGERIESITPIPSGYLLHSPIATYQTKNLILNTSIYQTATLFGEGDIRRYYEQFKLSDQSAFVIYLKLTTLPHLHHHYQIICDEQLPHAISDAFFVSFSDVEDEKLSCGGLSVTISTHTKASIWNNLTKEEYAKRKSETQERIMEQFMGYFTMIARGDIAHSFSATSVTFDRYLSRANCGGKLIDIKNILQTPSNNTPFRGLYNIGDSVYAGQGWPGISLGVAQLQRLLEEGR